MKYVITFFFGLAAGAAVALVLLYFNPLTGDAGRGRPAASWELGYALSPARASLLTHGEQLRLPVIPVDAPLLWEQGVRGTVLGVLALEDETGAAAVATRISVPVADSDLLLHGLFVDDYWLVTAPGRGSLFVHALDNQWPLLRDTVGRVDLLRRDWPGAATYDPTVGPGPGGRATVLGLSGEFTGERGTARDLITLERYGAAGFAELSGELLLSLDSEPR